MNLQLNTQYKVRIAQKDLFIKDVIKSFDVRWVWVKEYINKSINSAIRFATNKGNDHFYVKTHIDKRHLDSYGTSRFISSSKEFKTHLITTYESLETIYKIKMKTEGINQWTTRLYPFCNKNCIKLQLNQVVICETTEGITLGRIVATEEGDIKGLPNIVSSTDIKCKSPKEIKKELLKDLKSIMKGKK